MNVYTYFESRQSLASILDEAYREGAVGVRRKGGRMFVMRLEPSKGSLLDIKGMNLGVTTDEIVGFIRERCRES
jgi:hypothetical protein